MVTFTHALCGTEHLPPDPCPADSPLIEECRYCGAESLQPCNPDCLGWPVPSDPEQEN